MNRGETLRAQAERRLAGEISEEQFRAEIAAEEDLELLKSIAEELTPHTEVSIPIYQRVLEAEPGDPGTWVDLGFVYWLCGQDDDARSCLAQAYRLDPGHLKALLLDAALERDPREKRRLYERVLEKDPENQVARANLAELGEP